MLLWMEGHLLHTRAASTPTWIFGFRLLAMTRCFAEKRIQIEGKIVVHVHQNICTTLWQFLSLSGTSINVNVYGKRINRGGGHGLELPVQYKFLGLAKAIAWTKKDSLKLRKK